MYQSAMSTYQQSNFFTASPAQLVLMCYDGAISNLKLARDAYLEKDYYSKGKALQKTFDIIHELNASLDTEKGGIVAANLRGLYMYLIQSLTEADLKKDMATFDRSIRILEELATAWRAISTSKEVSAAEEPLPARAMSYSLPSSKPALAMAWV